MAEGANERYLRGWIAGGVLLALSAVVLGVQALTRVERSGGALEHACAAAAAAGAATAESRPDLALATPELTA
ncbi:MAG: hypothetical protein FJ299_16035, partial [Planctomycetes bacterium]|nr:hypothetical protein [Planctomycetota bacterium]